MAPQEPRWPGYGVPDGSYPTPPGRRTSHLRFLVILGITLAVVAAVISVVAWLLTPPTPHYHCPPNCRRPPTAPPFRSRPQGEQAPASSTDRTAPSAAGAPLPGNVAPGPPVQTLQRFTPRDGSFSVAYFPSHGSALTTALTDNGVAMTFSGNPTNGKVSLFGQPAGNQTARDIAAALVKANYPGAQLAYQIPNAMVGYQPGYGEIDDYYPQAAASSASHLRVLVVAAVKNDLALIAAAVGPYVKFVPPGSPSAAGTAVSGQPSGANLEVAQQIGGLIDSFMWKGDAPRVAR